MRPPRSLRTPRLLLRVPRAGDAGAVHAAWATDEAVLRHLDMGMAPDLAHTRARLAWDEARFAKGSAWTWLLCLGAAERPIGQVQASPQGLEAPVHHLRLGYLLAREHWGQGLMREALHALLGALWAQDGLWRVDAVVDTANPASARVLEALGLECEGLLRRHARHPLAGAAPRDVWLYAQVRAPLPPGAPPD